MSDIASNVPFKLPPALIEQAHKSIPQLKATVEMLKRMQGDGHDYDEMIKQAEQLLSVAQTTVDVFK